MSTASCFMAAAAATGDPVKLAMQRLWLSGQVLAAGARLAVEHVFRSEEAQPLEVIYCFALPRDAALRSFRITGEGFEAHSELKATEAAVKEYEAGVARGALSTLARQYGDGLINLTVGNIRPGETVRVHLEIVAGVELRDDGFRFRFPFTLAPGYHAQARTCVNEAGEGEMELPAGEFGDVILPRFRKDAAGLHEVGFELAVESGLKLEQIGSPSHAVTVRQDAGGARVALAPAKDLPDRDLVLDARFASVEPQVLAGRTRDGKGHFAAVAPSRAFGESNSAPRRVAILLDRSGSMQGEPLAQATRAISACLGALGETDQFGLVTFASDATAFEPALAAGTREARDRAEQFLASVKAAGGTELVRGFQAAARLLAGGGGDVLIVTDGQVMGAEQILAEARTAGARLHCLGIGSASQDRFLTLLARETGGVSRFVTPRERVDLTAVDLFASIGRPVAAGLKAGANVQPAPPEYVFAGTPVLLFGEMSDGEERIELSWTGGRLELAARCSEGGIGETLWLLQGSRLITDWESRYPASQALAALERRKESRVAARLRELSETYGLASREMSLVAVVKRAGDREGELPETRVVPVGMAQDVAFGAYFPPPMVAAATGLPDVSMLRTVMARQPGAMRQMEEAMGAARPRVGSRKFSGLFSRPARTPDAGETLIKLAARMDSDGGMPGQDTEARATATIVALMAFLSDGHTLKQGAFRAHVARLAAFLKGLTGLTAELQAIVERALELAKEGRAPRGDWMTMASKPPRRLSALQGLVWG